MFTRMEYMATAESKRHEHHHRLIEMRSSVVVVGRDAVARQRRIEASKALYGTVKAHLRMCHGSDKRVKAISVNTTTADLLALHTTLHEETDQ